MIAAFAAGMLKETTKRINVPTASQCSIVELIIQCAAYVIRSQRCTGGGREGGIRIIISRCNRRLSITIYRGSKILLIKVRPDLNARYL